MVKLGYTKPLRDLVKRRLNRMDAAALKMEHAHICGAAALSDMSTVANQKIFSKRWRKMGFSVESKTDGTNKRAQTEIKTATVPCAK